VPPSQWYLADLIVDLAGLDDDDPGVQPLLRSLPGVARTAVEGCDQASVTLTGPDGVSIVAVSSDLVRAVDAVQAELGGPCVEASSSGTVVAQPEIGASVRWPHFRRKAYSLGLRSLLSVPLWTARGEVIAALNLYGRTPGAFAQLTAQLRSVYDSLLTDPEDAPLPPPHLPPDAPLAQGVARAMMVQDLVQLAVGVMASRDNVALPEGYQRLVALAAAQQVPLRVAATQVIAAAVPN